MQPTTSGGNRSSNPVSNREVRERVAHAYYDYGRFCAAHPFACLSISISTILLLSYPAIGRLNLPTSSSIDVFSTNNLARQKHRAANLDAKSENHPDWLNVAPTAYLQQIIVRSVIEPWDVRKLNPTLAVKGALSRSVKIRKKLNEFVSKAESKRLEDYCLHVHSQGANGRDLLPNYGCLVLSPSSFWSNDEERFYRDNDVLATVFGQPCTPDMCVRNLLLGMPTRMTGIKLRYQTNRQRSIDYAVTLVLSEYNENYVESLKSSLSGASEFQLLKSAQENPFVHVFYRPRKYLSDYLPVITGYILFVLYMTFSASKFEMVKSRWGLGLAAIFTFAATLMMTAGICSQFDLTPTIWGAELFPYLAMIVGLENTLCISRSVVYTPPHLAVWARLAHGLSHEGYSITKNFLLEVVILAIGWLTMVAEIQDFCTFAVTGLFVDFYMQLFFFAPCLTFDLMRLGAEEKQRFCLMLFKTDQVELIDYPQIQCPVRKLWPRLFDGLSSPSKEKGGRFYKTRSESKLDNLPLETTPNKAPGHRRTASSTTSAAVSVNVSHHQQTKPRKSQRLKILYHWTRTRFLQRIIMIATLFWIFWLAVIVHKFNLLQTASLAPSNPASSEAQEQHQSFESRKLEETETTNDGVRASELVQWQRRTFKWWPVLFNEYNISLSTRYLTFLPPIVLKAIVPPDDPSIVFSGGGAEEVEDRIADENTEKTTENSGVLTTLAGGGTEIKYRISWLELQMSAVLIISFGLFATVTAFIFYVCFWSRGINKRIDGTTSTALDSHQNVSVSSFKKGHKRVGSKAVVESVPTVFSGHTLDVECVCSNVANNNLVVSSCIGGKLLVWDASTGECLKRLPRTVTQLNRRQQSSRINGISMSVCDPSISAETDQQAMLRRRTTSNANALNGNAQANIPLGSQLSSSGSVNLDQNSGSRTLSPPETPTFSPIWCLHITRQNIILAGCGNGSVELWDGISGAQVGLYTRGNVGVTYVKLIGSRLITVRVNGTLDFVEVHFSQSQSSEQTLLRLSQSTHLNTVRAHQLPINGLLASALSAVTASDDHTLKLFDLRTCRHSRTLYGHNAPVRSVYLDESVQVIYSSCLEGNIFCWDLIDGELLRTIDDAMYTFAPVQLACTETLLIGYTVDGCLKLWQKGTYALVSSIGKDPPNDSNNNQGREGEFLTGEKCLVPLDDQFVVTSDANAIVFWDLRYKAMLREVKLDGPQAQPIQHLQASDTVSILCSKGPNIYRVSNPVIRFK